MRGKRRKLIGGKSERGGGGGGGGGERERERELELELENFIFQGL